MGAGGIVWLSVVDAGGPAGRFVGAMTCAHPYFC
jgi:hypothetical protein